MRQIGYCYEIDEERFQELLSTFYRIRECDFAPDLRWGLDSREVSYLRGVADTIQNGERLHRLANLLQKLSNYMEYRYIRLDIARNP